MDIGKPTDYLDYIRGYVCLVCPLPGEAHHLIAVGSGADRSRQMARHYTAIPLCREHHREIESEGEAVFEEKHGCDIHLMALKFFMEYVEPIIERTGGN